MHGYILYISMQTQIRSKARACCQFLRTHFRFHATQRKPCLQFCLQAEGTTPLAYKHLTESRAALGKQRYSWVERVQHWWPGQHGHVFRFGCRIKWQTRVLVELKRRFPKISQLRSVVGVLIPCLLTVVYTYLAQCLNSVLNMKAVVAAFNQEQGPSLCS